jgi:hypothetical protein
MAYLLNILIALDQLATALIGGYPDETLSSYAYRLEAKGRPFGRIFRPFIDWLFAWGGEGHCRSAYFAEKQRRQLPVDLR